MNQPLAIETRLLKKRYVIADDEDIQAVRGVNLAVGSGEIYALLGPNGAGKTTTISMLTTLLPPTSGEAKVVGFDVVTQPAEVRRHIGVTFQEVVLDEELTGRYTLDFHAQLYGMGKAERTTRIEELAALVELDDALDRHVKSYSGGMKRRLELARGLMTSPDVLFLDEPTQGLDPHNRAGIWRYIRHLRDDHGITLLLTTHYMDEAETLADRVGIIDHGELVVEGRPHELVRQMGSDVINIGGAGAMESFVAKLDALAYVTQTAVHMLDDDPEKQNAYHIQIGVDSGDHRLADLIGLASACEFRIHEISVAKPSLGDVFLAHTGHALRD